MPRWAREESGSIILLFGKYRGQPIQAAPDSYLRWMVNQYVENNSSFDEDLIVAIEEELNFREYHNLKVED